jgi:hypothetical protein
MIKKLTINHLIWFLPVIYVIHNLEEWLTMNAWFGSHPSTINFFLEKYIPTWFWQNFNSIGNIALIVATILPFALYFIINKTQKKYSVTILTIVGWIMVINSSQHIVMTLLMRTYTPGVASAAFIIIPFAFVFLNFIQNNQDLILPKKAKWILWSLLIYPLLMLCIWVMASLSLIIYSEAFG